MESNEVFNKMFWLFVLWVVGLLCLGGVIVYLIGVWMGVW